jgi:Ni,Fe-hydrogenase III large subunit
MMALLPHIASSTPVAHHAPWPRFIVSEATWNAVGLALGRGEGDLLALWAERDTVHMAVRAPGEMPVVVSLPVVANAFPSIGRRHAPAIRLERAVCDLFGFSADYAPDARRWLDHDQWGIRAPLGVGTPAPVGDPVDYAFQRVIGEGLHQIPVGPVHAGIIEPGHFRFTANGETVARLEGRLGYVHKGIDGLTSGADIAVAARVVARTSGDSTVAASFAFARAVEVALGIEVPVRARVLRGVMAELERIANHFGDIGAICNDAAFTLLHAYCGILRERVLAACDHVFGHRLMMDCVVPGGVARNIVTDGPRLIGQMLDEVAPQFDEIVRYYDDTPSLLERTRTTGFVSPELVRRFAAGGHVGRASGRDFDTRRDLPYAPYDGVAFEVPKLDAGDVDARVWVRIHEVRASIKLLRGWLAALPDSVIAVTVPPSAEPREGIAMVEAFRGDFFVWLRILSGRVERCHVRDASWFQWPLLEAAIEGNIVADFPLCNKSFNCSYSGHDI